jgi:hypothetical protein
MKWLTVYYCNIRNSSPVQVQGPYARTGAYLDGRAVSDTTPFAVDVGHAEKLWELSDELAEAKFEY